MAHLPKTILLSIILLASFLILSPFSGNSVSAEKMSKELVNKLLSGETFIIVNLSSDNAHKRRFLKDGTWVDIVENGQVGDFGTWRVNDAGQFCLLSNFRVDGERCSYIIKEGGNYLSYNEKVNQNGENIIEEVTSWKIADDYITGKNNDKYAADIERIRKKALEAAPAAGKEDEGIFQRIKNFFIDLFH